MRISFSLSLLFLFSLIIISSVIFSSSASAASCSSSLENDLEDFYDDMVDDFDTLIEESEIWDSLDNIEVEVKHGRGVRSADVGFALRAAERDHRNLENDMDDLIDDILALEDRSKYEDCIDEIRDVADDFERYAEKELEKIESAIEDITEDTDSLPSDRGPTRLKAPLWNADEEESDAERRAAPQVEKEDEKISASLLDEIQALMQEIRLLIVAYAQAKVREAKARQGQ